ncbi:hypothetical protein BDQ17DRAFT_1422691 [Cyathus striatus]|nr:hypothetical protein BDQ17DRAFT_1422691 [Cyathus striatus]
MSKLLMWKTGPTSKHLAHSWKLSTWDGGWRMGWIRQVKYIVFALSWLPLSTASSTGFSYSPASLISIRTANTLSFDNVPSGDLREALLYGSIDKHTYLLPSGSDTRPYHRPFYPMSTAAYSTTFSTICFIREAELA